MMASRREVVAALNNFRRNGYQRLAAEGLPGEEEPHGIVDQDPRAAAGLRPGSSMRTHRGRSRTLARLLGRRPGYSPLEDEVEMAAPGGLRRWVRTEDGYFTEYASEEAMEVELRVDRSDSALPLPGFYRTDSERALDLYRNLVLYYEVFGASAAGFNAVRQLCNVGPDFPSPAYLDFCGYLAVRTMGDRRTAAAMRRGCSTTYCEGFPAVFCPNGHGLCFCCARVLWLRAQNDEEEDEVAFSCPTCRSEELTVGSSDDLYSPVTSELRGDMFRLFDVEVPVVPTDDQLALGVYLVLRLIDGRVEWPFFIDSSVIREPRPRAAFERRALEFEPAQPAFGTVARVEYEILPAVAPAVLAAPALPGRPALWFPPQVLPDDVHLPGPAEWWFQQGIYDGLTVEQENLVRRHTPLVWINFIALYQLFYESVTDFNGVLARILRPDMPERFQQLALVDSEVDTRPQEALQIPAGMAHPNLHQRLYRPPRPREEQCEEGGSEAPACEFMEAPSSVSDHIILTYGTSGPGGVRLPRMTMPSQPRGWFCVDEAVYGDELLVGPAIRDIRRKISRFEIPVAADEILLPEDFVGALGYSCAVENAIVLDVCIRRGGLLRKVIFVPEHFQYEVSVVVGATTSYRVLAVHRQLDEAQGRERTSCVVRFDGVEAGGYVLAGRCFDIQYMRGPAALAGALHRSVLAVVRANGEEMDADTTHVGFLAPLANCFRRNIHRARVGMREEVVCREAKLWIDLGSSTAFVARVKRAIVDCTFRVLRNVLGHEPKMSVLRELIDKCFKAAERQLGGQSSGDLRFLFDMRTHHIPRSYHCNELDCISVSKFNGTLQNGFRQPAETLLGFQALCDRIAASIEGYFEYDALVNEQAAYRLKRHFASQKLVGTMMVDRVFGSQETLSGALVSWFNTPARMAAPSCISRPLISTLARWAREGTLQNDVMRANFIRAYPSDFVEFIKAVLSNVENQEVQTFFALYISAFDPALDLSILLSGRENFISHVCRQASLTSASAGLVGGFDDKKVFLGRICVQIVEKRARYLAMLLPSEPQKN